MPEATTTSGANAAGPRWTPHRGLFLWSQRGGDAGQRLSVSGALDQLHRLSLRAPAPTVAHAENLPGPVARRGKARFAKHLLGKEEGEDLSSSVQSARRWALSPAG